jgi:hypothetical protein
MDPVDTRLRSHEFRGKIMLSQLNAMNANINAEAVLVPSDNIVAREIEGELLIVPLVSGIGDTDEELFTMNETGRAIWALLDGQRSLHAIAQELAREFDAAESAILSDILGLMQELWNRKMIAIASHPSATPSPSLP